MKKTLESLEEKLVILTRRLEQHNYAMNRRSRQMLKMKEEKKWLHDKIADLEISIQKLKA